MRGDSRGRLVSGPLRSSTLSSGLRKPPLALSGAIRSQSLLLGIPRKVRVADYRQGRPGS